MSPNLSVIVICRNEALHIERCLQSVHGWADEIVVIDSGSTDGTLEICKRYTEHVHSFDWPGFGPQKNRALARAKGRWILSLDADEWVPAPLAQEIQTAIQNTHVSGYWIKRHSFFCGHLLLHGDWSNDRVLRLFQKSHAQFSNDVIHERVLLEGNTQTLKEVLKHHAFDHLEEVIEKLNRYSSLKAPTLKSSPFPLLTALSHASWTFLRGYLFRRGFLDGSAGFVLAVSNALGCFYAYLKQPEWTASSALKISS